MKTKFYITIVLAMLTALAFLNYNSSSTNLSSNPPLPGNNDFIISVLEAGAETGYSRLNELNINLWAKYTIPREKMGWITFHNQFARNDSLYALLGDYQSYVSGVLQDNETNNMITLMMRPKIEYLCYGQRSDYQCEESLADPDYWFYAYNIHNPNVSTDYTDNSQYGNGARVRYCRNINSTNEGSWIHQPGYVVSGLKANREQCATNCFSSDYQIDSKYRWYIKPRIRIDSIYANNPNNRNINVCKVELYSFDNNQVPFDTFNIKVKNLLNGNDFYDGTYKEEFRIFPGEDSLIANGIDFNPNNGDWQILDTSDSRYSKVDIRVYWYGQCDMWLDYVRVDNEVADKLFKGYYDDPNNPDFEWLKWEVQTIGMQETERVFRFYIEEFEFNNRPCMKYVNDKIKALSSNRFSLMCNPYWGGYNQHKPWYNHETYQFTKEEFKRTLFEYVGLKEIFMGSYAFKGYYRSRTGSTAVYVPETLPISTYCPDSGRFSLPLAPAQFDDSLQGYLDDPNYIVSQRGEFRFYNEMCDYMSKELNIPEYTIVQTHLWYDPNGPIYREPTNEDLDLLVNVPLTYGSKGILYFWYTSWGALPVVSFDSSFGRGLTNPINPSAENVHFLQPGVTYEPRTENVYGQNKWNKVVEINQRLKNWAPYIMSFDNDNRHTFIYRLPNDRNSFLNNSNYYFQIIQTYPPNPNNFNEPLSSPDAQDNTYLQAAVFNNPDEQFSKYFMLVNRRCSPPKQEDQETAGLRFVKVTFDANASPLNHFVNWKLKDLEDNSVVAVINASTATTVDLGRYNPGEGKLYKLIPVMVDGGTFAYDEICGGIEFPCNGQVNNGTQDLTIIPGTTIDFSNEGKIVMSYGELTIGSNGDNVPGVTLRGKTGNYWDGITLSKCTNVNIFHTGINDIVPYLPGINYAIKLTDCPFLSVVNCTFEYNQNTNAGCIFANLINSARNYTQYIYGNNFNTIGPSITAIASGSGSVPFNIDGNTFTAPENQSVIAITMDNISGAVKNNFFTDYLIALNVLSSSIDIYNNNISSNVPSSIGILGGSNSTLNMTSGDTWLAGHNVTSYTAENSYNLKVDNSCFIVNNGNNTFNINEPSNSLHLYGTMSGTEINPYYAKYNCFPVNDQGSTPTVDVIWPITNDPVIFSFYSPECYWDNIGDAMVINIAPGINDTIYARLGGSGGAKSNSIIVTVKSMYDSICLDMRKRNYVSVKNKCRNLLDIFPDSTQSLDAVSKLYTSSTLSDTSISSRSELKTYYETIMLNNSTNLSLMKKAYYYTQKCKVLLKQYSSAMAGFQQIIESNPYSYEALVAQWDYMATHLLDSLSGGAVMGDGDDDKYDNENDDRKPKLTKEQKKFVRETTTTLFQDERKKADKRIDDLTISAKREDKKAKKELEQTKTLKEATVLKHPKNVNEYIKIVNEDISKVFGGEKRNTITETKFIPQTFELYQNFPNPFNPVTKIKYDIPKTSKVKLIIYDILGREVITLINNEFKEAGRYIAEFNAGSFASGVYFYRIEMGDYTICKKLVLLK
jgi:hypothetical protein